jgi:hypothetical protein
MQLRINSCSPRLEVSFLVILPLPEANGRPGGRWLGSYSVDRIAVPGSMYSIAMQAESLEVAQLDRSFTDHHEASM